MPASTVVWRGVRTRARSEGASQHCGEKQMMLRRQPALASSIGSAVVLLAMLLGLSLVASPLAFTAPQAQDAGGVVRAFIAARNAGDIDGAAAMVSDNAIYIRGAASGACSRQSPCLGRPAILLSL